MRITEAELRKAELVRRLQSLELTAQEYYSSKDALVHSIKDGGEPKTSAIADRSYYSGRQGALRQALDLIEEIL